MAEWLARALRAFRVLNAEQRASAVGALLLVASTFGPFSFVEAAEILLALGVLALLFARAEGKRFHLPFGDGTAVAAAGTWAGLLIVVRLFDRSLEFGSVLPHQIKILLRRATQIALGNLIVQHANHLWIAGVDETDPKAGHAERVAQALDDEDVLDRIRFEPIDQRRFAGVIKK